MRLDKFIAENTHFSRRDVRQLIKRGLVYSNDKLMDTAQHTINPEHDIIKVQNAIVEYCDYQYIVFHKPKGVICATSDANHPTIIDCLSTTNAKSQQDRIDTHIVQKLQIVGRLDKDTTGLIFLTTDGHWNHIVTSPKQKCFKGYKVTLEKSLSADDINKIKTGIILKNELVATLPAKIETAETEPIISQNTAVKTKRKTKKNTFDYNIYIQEGRYHQIKRMMAALNNHVVELHRFSIGEVYLTDSLKQKQYMMLDKNDVKRFFKND